MAKKEFDIYIYIKIVNVLKYILWKGYNLKFIIYIKYWNFTIDKIYYKTFELEYIITTSCQIFQAINSSFIKF